MAGPSSSHAARYIPGIHGDHEDGRLHSPVFLRNSPRIIAVLSRLFEGRAGPVLEIGAGTGQHAAAFSLAFPDLEWWPSDPDPDHRRSIRAWSAELRAPGHGPLDIDAASDWAGRAEVAALGPLQAVVSLNVIHIAPLAVAEGIVRGAGAALTPGGLLVFYGPFNEGGAYTGPGNAAFDAGLRADNPDWGLRDIGEIGALAEAAGMGLRDVVTMPADNRVVVFGK